MEFMKLIHAKINQALVGAYICDFMTVWLIWCDWFTLFNDTHTIILCLIANTCFPWNKPVHHSGT